MIEIARRPQTRGACSGSVIDAAAILIKLASGQMQDLADISRMLALADDAMLEQVLDIVRRYARDSGAAEDIDSLLEIGRWELGRA